MLGLQRDNLKPVRKEAFRSRNDYDPAAATMPKQLAPTHGGEANVRGTPYNRRPYQPRNVWWRSGMRCSDPGARMSKSAADLVDRQETEEVEPLSRRARFRPRNTEPDDKLDVDQVLTFLDQMNFKPSRNKAAGSCPAAANADSAGSPATSDDSKSTPTTREPRALSSETPVGDDTDVTLFQSTDAAGYTTVRNVDLVTTPPGAAHIPDSVVAWKSLSSEKCTDPDTWTSSEPLYSGSPEPAEYESSHGRDGRQVPDVTDSGQGDSPNPLFESGADNLLTDAVALLPSERYVASSSRQLDDVACDDIAGKTELEGAVFSPQRPPVSHFSPPHFSTDGVSTPRLLSADASYYLEQEDGDVIIESGSEEEFDE